jgi:hypothetical protein
MALSTFSVRNAHKNTISRAVIAISAVAVAACLIFGLALSGCSDGALQAPPDSANDSAEGYPDEDAGESAPVFVEISAKEAIEIVCEAAKSAVPEPLVMDTNSTDYSAEGYIPDINSGADGKRLVWYVGIGNKERTKQLYYKIENGVLSLPHQVDETGGELAGQLHTGTFTNDDVNVDSAEAVKIAIEQKGLLPGDPDKPANWLKGYHFRIGPVFVSPESHEQRFVITVSGISPNTGELSHITIDQETGEIIGATEQIGYDEEGHSRWQAY